MTSRRVSRWGLSGGLLLLATASPGLAPGLIADAPVFPTQLRIADDELDGVRGGFVLPNGMDVAVGIDIQTTVNGALALRTVLSTAGNGLPVVFTGTNGTPSTPEAEGASTATIPGVGIVRIVEGPAPAQGGGGQQRVELTSNGPAVVTQSGSIQLTRDDSGSVVVLNNDSLELRHMIGNFTGSLVANTANDRSIDSVVTVNIGLQNSAVPMSNAMLRWESIAIEAAGRSIH